MQVVIHAGAAFTDEGRVLRSLQANGDTLSSNGVALLGPRRYRKVFKSALDGLGREEPVSLLPVQQIVPDSVGIKRMVHSSEGFIGETSQAIHEGQLYPHAGQRMAFVDQSFGDNEVELFFALLHPGTFIPKVLMSLPETQRQDIIAHTDLGCLSWLSMIEDITDLAPNVRMTLWSNEDTPLIWGNVVRAIAGLDQEAVVEGEYALLTSLLSDEGRNEALALIGDDTVQDTAGLRSGLARILDAHARPDKIEEDIDMPGWSGDIFNAFSELYEQDLEQIQTMPGVRFLRP